MDSLLHSDTQQRPLFSIVTVCRNAETTIRRTIQSVLAQTFSDYEYLVIDGASTDLTGEHVQNSRPDFAGTTSGVLRYISEPDAGIYDAMNKGLALARGDYLVFLNADDWLEADALQVVADLLSPAVDCVAGATRIFAPDGSAHIQLPREELLQRPFPPAMPATHQSWFARTELLRELGGFDSSFAIAADYELFLRLQKRNRLWAFTPRVLANFSLGGASYAVLATAAEYRRAKRVNGDSLLHAWMVYFRNSAAACARRIVATTTKR
ncbi:MAG: glycosyltransferase [Coriobacteriia bacterium]|nr:glycosyltransferase [Coriobacteriia bacterium]